MPHILFVANERVWPVRGGGPARMAGVIGAVAAAGVRVTVAEPGDAGTAAPPSEAPAAVDRRQYSSPGARPWHSLSLAPRRGRAILGAAGGEVRALARSLGVDAVVFSHSYLAPGVPDAGVPVVVDFPNLEVDRNRSLARVGGIVPRASAALEAAKAMAWEPRVARRARTALAVTEPDLRRLEAWGGRPVLVPNAVDRRHAVPSPAEGPVVFVANTTYAPNREAGRVLIDEIWPAVHDRWPSARLVVAGRGTCEAFGPNRDPTVEVRGEVDDVAAVFDEAAVVVSPVAAGAGTQLKVVEALGRGRVVVTSPYGTTGLPPGAEVAVSVADGPAAMAASVVGALADVDGRHQREGELVRRAAVPTWAEACAPLVALLTSLARR